MPLLAQLCWKVGCSTICPLRFAMNPLLSISSIKLPVHEVFGQHHFRLGGFDGIHNGLDSFGLGKGAFAHGCGDAGVAMLRPLTPSALRTVRANSLLVLKTYTPSIKPSANFRDRSRFVSKLCRPELTEAGVVDGHLQHVYEHTAAAGF